MSTQVIPNNNIFICKVQNDTNLSHAEVPFITSPINVGGVVNVDCVNKCYGYETLHPGKHSLVLLNLTDSLKQHHARNKEHYKTITDILISLAIL